MGGPSLSKGQRDESLGSWAAARLGMVVEYVGSRKRLKTPPYWGQSGELTRPVIKSTDRIHF